MIQARDHSAEVSTGRQKSGDAAFSDDQNGPLFPGLRDPPDDIDCSSGVGQGRVPRIFASFSQPASFGDDGPFASELDRRKFQARPRRTARNNGIEDSWPERKRGEMRDRQFQRLATRNTRDAGFAAALRPIRLFPAHWANRREHLREPPSERGPAAAAPSSST